MSYYYYPGNTYFTTYKTRRGEKVFIEDEDKDVVLKQIRKVQDKFNIELFAFAVLSNHYHLMFKCDDFKLVRKMLQLINGGS